MAQVFYADDDGYRALMSSGISSQAQQYLATQFNNASEYLQQSPLFQKAVTAYEYFASGEAIRQAKSFIQNATDFFTNLDVIKPIYTLEEFQNATPYMARFIMAEPTVRTLFHQNEINGYSDIYVDNYHGSVGENHPDWCLVNNGMLKIDEEEDRIKFNYYFHDDDQYLEEMKTFTVEEQFAALDIWSTLNKLMQDETVDPTNPFGGER